jgi:hypothetical protein
MVRRVHQMRVGGQGFLGYGARRMTCYGRGGGRMEVGQSQSWVVRKVCHVKVEGQEFLGVRWLRCKRGKRVVRMCVGIESPLIERGKLEQRCESRLERTRCEVQVGVTKSLPQDWSLSWIPYDA